MTWDEVETALWGLAQGPVRRDEIAAWVQGTAKQARWLPPAMTFQLILEAAVTVSDPGFPCREPEGGSMDTS